VLQPVIRGLRRPADPEEFSARARPLVSVQPPIAVAALP
jgi:hypothetical protein